MKFGCRAAKHDAQDATRWRKGRISRPDPFNPANLPAWNGETYPGNFASGLGGDFPRNVWMLVAGRARALGRPVLESRSGRRGATGRVNSR